MNENLGNGNNYSPPFFCATSKKRKTNMEYDHPEEIGWHSNNNNNNNNNNNSIHNNFSLTHKHECKTKEVSIRNKFLFLHPGLNVYHTGSLSTEPYSTNQKTEETLYHPLKENVLVNTKSYDEILFKTGTYFLSNTNGSYDRTVEGHAINLLKHCPQERRLYIARSFVFPEKEHAESVERQLFDR